MEPPHLPDSPPPVARQESSRLALASLILGIAGIALCLGPLAGIPAVICGHAAQKRIRNSGGVLTGGGQAVAGLITGYCAIALGLLIALLAAIAVPNYNKAYNKARQNAQRSACVANRKAIQAAKEIWALENRKPGGAIPKDDDLFGPDKMILEKPVCPAGGIYELRAVTENPTCSIPGHD